MYIPASFVETDQNILHDFIEQHSFATLASQNDSEPFASHLPLLLDRQSGPHGTLIGHMARANPQWKQADGQKVLAIFTGPHAYISPTWYEDENVVPTWNYVATHATGTFQLDDDRHRRLEIVRQYVDRYESQMPNPWALDLTDQTFIDQLLDAIVGFKIDISRIEGKWKTNQNQDERRRKRVADALMNDGSENAREIACLINKTLR